MAAPVGTDVVGVDGALELAAEPVAAFPASVALDELPAETLPALAAWVNAGVGAVRAAGVVEVPAGVAGFETLSVEVEVVAVVLARAGVAGAEERMLAGAVSAAPPPDGAVAVAPVRT